MHAAVPPQVGEEAAAAGILIGEGKAGRDTRGFEAEGDAKHPFLSSIDSLWPGNCQSPSQRPGQE